MACYLSTNRPFVLDPELDLETLLESYVCSSKCTISTKGMKWRCLAFSSITELHNGYMNYNSGLDYVISHTRNVVFCKLVLFIVFVILLVCFSLCSRSCFQYVTWDYFV